MVEEPQNTYLVREEKTSHGSDPLAEDIIDTEVTVVKTKPITSKIKSTVKHLQSRAGFRARWRGLSLFIVYGIAHSMLTGFLGNLLAGMQFNYTAGPVQLIMRSIGSILASIILARYATAWVHIVISEPSSKSWYRRVPSVKTWKNVWAPAALVDMTSRLAFILPAACGVALGLDGSPSSLQSESPLLIASKVLICASVGLLTLFALVVPACVSLVRVQASMLPEEDESIVPFDRTFGGKVVPEILGGTGCIKFMDAWRTFDMAARARIVKMFVKFIMVEVGLHAFFCVVLALEALVLVGPENIRRTVAELM